MSKSRAEWNATAQLTTSARSTGFCHVPQKIATQLRVISQSQGSHSSLVILALDLQHQWSSDNGITKPSTLFIPWSGEVSQQHTDCIEIPREYALVNGFSPDSTQAAPDGSELSGTSPSDGVNQFPVVVSVLSPLEFYPLEGAVLVPASLLDWQVIYTHKTLIEDSLLQKLSILYAGQHIRLPVLPTLTVNLKVQSICREGALPSRASEEMESKTSASVRNVAMTSTQDLKSSEKEVPLSWFRSVYNNVLEHVSEVNQLCNEGAPGANNEEKGIIGLLTRRTAITIESPPEEDEKKDENASIHELSPGKSQPDIASVQQMCHLTSQNLLRVLPESLQHKDTSYFGHQKQIHSCGESSTGQISECKHDSLHHILNSLLNEEEDDRYANVEKQSTTTSFEEMHSSFSESLCTCIVHPLFLLAAEDMARGNPTTPFASERYSPSGSMFGMEHISRTWQDVAFTNEDSASKSAAFLSFLGYLEKCPWKAPTFFHGINLTQQLSLSDDDENNDGKNFVQGLAVRVIVSEAVRPFHIFISTPARRSLCIRDFDSVRLTLMSPSVSKPLLPGDVKFNIQTPTAGVKFPTLDCFRLALLNHRSQAREQNENSLMFPSGATIVVPPSSNHGSIRFIICFDDTSNIEQSGTPSPCYMNLTSDATFTSVVNAICAVFGSGCCVETRQLSESTPQFPVQDFMQPSVPIPGDMILTPLSNLYGISDILSILSADILSHFLPRASFQRVTSVGHPFVDPRRIVSGTTMKSNFAIPGPIGSLIVGEEGTGKSALLAGFAHSLSLSTRTLVHPIVINCKTDMLLNSDRKASLNDVVSRLKCIFDEAFEKAPCLICIDDIDFLCKNMRTEDNEPAHDAGAVIRNEKVCDCLVDLMSMTKKNNELCTHSADKMYDYMQSQPKHNESEMLLHEGIQFFPDLLSYAPHRIVHRCLDKAVYVLASSRSPDTLHRRFMDIFSLGRHVVTLPTCLPPTARVSILRSSLVKLGWPLQLGDETDGHGSNTVQQRLKNDENVIQKLTEGYQPTDLWTLARKIVAACITANYVHPASRPVPTKNHSQYRCFLQDVIRTCDSFVPRSDLNMKFIKAPDKSSTWKDIGGYASVKKSLFDTFRRPMMFRKLYVRNKIKFPRGVMLFGPPGTGKTALARTTGGELGLPLISVRGPELLNKYIGESERAVRSLFDKAKGLGRPCLIFFDEFEALAPKRGADSSGGASDRVVNQLLTYLDGVESTMGNSDMTGGQIFIVVATSRPDMIDSALLRPGRIARHIYVGLPTLDERRLILETRLRDINLCDEVHVTLETLMTCVQAETMTGADWKGVVDTAFLHASAEHFKTVGVKTTTHESINLTKPTLNDQFPLTSAHFLNAFGQIKPSLSHQELSFYEGINKKFIPSPSSTGSTASEKPKPAIGVGKKQCFA